MAKEISGAKVVGRAQNRTALGMIHAFAKMHHLTLSQLVNQLPKAKICPDCGTDKVFYTFDEVQRLRNSGEKWFDNACFTENSELIHLDDGNKVTLVKMWTEKSLKLLQEALAKHNIRGEVDRSHKGNAAGFSIYYDYHHIPENNDDDDEEETAKLSPIFWVILLLVLVVGGYFAYTFFFK